MVTKNCACRWDGAIQQSWCREHHDKAVLAYRASQGGLLIAHTGIKLLEALRIAWGHHYPAGQVELLAFEEAIKIWAWERASLKVHGKVISKVKGKRQNAGNPGK